MALPENIQTALADSRQDKQSFNQLWDICISYTMGKQNLAYSSRDKRYIVPETREITFNLILNIYRNVTSRLTAAYPNIAVYPASPSQEDILKAQSSELALRYTWAEQDMIKKYQDLSQWLITCGNAGFHTFYDPGKDKVVVKVVSPYDIFYEKYAISEDESSWEAVRSYINRKEAIKAFPEYAKMIQDQPQATRDYSALSQGEPLPKDTIEMFDVYSTDGEYGIVIGREYVFKGELAEGLKPLQLIKYTDIPSVLWGWSMVAPLIDIQTQYNRTRNQIIKNTEIMANPKWLIPKTSGVNANSITDEPGEKVFYNPGGGAPAIISMPTLPPYVMESAMALQNEMSDISGVHSVTLGKRAVGISSGKAIESMSSLDTSQLQLTQNNIENATKIVAKNILILMKQYYTEPKWMRMMDGTGKVIFKELSNLDIVDDPEVFIEAGSLFQSEIQDKEAKIMQMLQLGLYTPQEAKEMLSTRTANKDTLQKMSNIYQAQKILEAVKSGSKVEIFKDENLLAYKQVFKDFMDQDEYYDLPVEIQDYISDLYKAILSSLRQSQQTNLQTPGIDQEHESILQSSPIQTQNLQQVATMNSASARGQIVEDAFSKAQKEHDLRSAKSESIEQGGPAIQGM